MRLPVTKALRVKPGDLIVVRASLPVGGKLARLYAWVKQDGDNEFSPYVQGLNENIVVLDSDGHPHMFQTIYMRLVEQRPSNSISFMADFNGKIVIIQEVDTKNDKVANVRLERTMRHAPVLSQLKRRLTEWPTTIRL